MKKIISVAAAVSIAAGMLTGCGEKKMKLLRFAFGRQRAQQRAL